MYELCLSPLALCLPIDCFSHCNMSSIATRMCCVSTQSSILLEKKYTVLLESIACPNVIWGKQHRKSTLLLKQPHLPSPCIVCHGISSRDPSGGPGSGLSAAGLLPGSTPWAPRTAILYCLREGSRGSIAVSSVYFDHPASFCLLAFNL